MLKWLVIFVGSGVGGLLRYGVGGLVQHWWGPTFPLGTLVVNVTGCLTIGFLATVLQGPLLVREEVRLGLLIGVLGGYTTFSTFSRETLALFHDGQGGRAAAYVLLSVVLCLASVWAGTAIAQRIYGPGGGP